MTRKLPSLTRFGTLRDLDLQDVGINQVMRGDTETAGRNLLDTGVSIAVKTRRVFAAFTGV